MDSEKFDALTRRVGAAPDPGVGLVNSVLGAGAAAVALRLGMHQGQSEAARDCRDYGCSCNGGVYRSCRGDLVCCPWSAGVPGGLGLCLTEDECYGPTCINSGDACAPYCGWGTDCPDCCSGYCNDFGVCDTPRCTGSGCACSTGAYMPCDWGLTCCPLQTGLLGGPGVCAPEGSC
ncbi:MAG: hypothetical protein R2853_10790 [Thermomicrobiales bacterium]